MIEVGPTVSDLGTFVKKHTDLIDEGFNRCVKGNLGHTKSIAK